MTPKLKPNIYIGMFLYNEEQYLSKAIEGLLMQTYKDFKLVILDDCSTDNTENIVLHYADIDNRITYLKNETRKGYCANFYKVFDLCGENIDYFAWAAGHDMHHKSWLETLLYALNKNPEAVLAYPLTKRIDQNDNLIPIPSPVFDTSGLSRAKRISSTIFKCTGFGNMNYGLFRAGALRKSGIYPQSLVPDVLLLSRLSLYGSFIQINKKLWYRRFARSFDIKRQKLIAFNPAPWYANIPWPLANSFLLLWNTVLKPTSGSISIRFMGLYLSLLYFVRYSLGEIKKKLIETGFFKKQYEKCSPFLEKVRAKF